MRNHLALVTLAALVAAASAGARATNATTHAAQQFTFAGETIGARALPIKVTAHGAITARGTAYLVEHASTTSGTFVFSGGTIRIRFVHGATNAKPDPAACRATIYARGTYAITGGAGRFAGITGKGTYRERRMLIGKRRANGACIADRRATPKSVTAVATMSGTVSLG
jgi:hypothetical protein